jgi:hypothetical protein
MMTRAASARQPYKALFDALDSKDEANFEKLLTDKIEECGHVGVDSRDEYGRTLLHVAAENGLPNDVRVLLDKGAQVNTIADRHPCVHFEYTSPLYVAVVHQNHDIARMLLDAGASVDVVAPMTNNSMLHVAADNQDAPMIRELLKRGAKVYLTNNRGETPLHCAINALFATTLRHRVGRSSEVIETLLSEGHADPNRRDAEQRTCLASAIHVWQQYHTSDVREIFYNRIICPLLQHGANPFIKNANNENILLNHDDFYRLCNGIGEHYDIHFEHPRYFF